MKTRSYIIRGILIFAAAALLFLFISTASSNHVTSETKKITEKTEWIMIGDSYAVRPLSNPKKTWPRLLRKRLGLTKSQAYLIQKPGWGIARTGKRYYQLLKKLESSENVKYIVIQSGPANDRKMSKKQIIRETKRLARLIRKKYPNAEVYYCSPNWNDISKKMRKFIRTRKKWYRSYAKKNGWHYMKSIHNIYVGDHTWCVKDGHHPNARGVRKLVRAMYKELKSHM